MSLWPLTVTIHLIFPGEGGQIPSIDFVSSTEVKTGVLVELVEQDGETTFNSLHLITNVVFGFIGFFKYQRGRCMIDTKISGFLGSRHYKGKGFE